MDGDLHEQFPHFDISRLSPRQREVVTMRFCGGCSQHEIASLLGISRWSVRRRLDEALHALRAQSPPRVNGR